MKNDEGFTLAQIYDAIQNGGDDECYECGGERWVTADCFEDTCCCLDPETEHGVEPCPLCNPEGRR